MAGARSFFTCFAKNQKRERDGCVTISSLILLQAFFRGLMSPEMNSFHCVLLADFFDDFKAVRTRSQARFPQFFSQVSR